MPITAYIVALAALLAIPADRYHRFCLAAIIFGLAVLLVLARFVEAQVFYPMSALLWLVVAFTLLEFNAGWKSVKYGSILLAVAGVTVFPAWLERSELAPFASASLVISDLCGVLAIFAFGAPGLRRAVTWLVGVGRDRRRGRFSDRPSAARPRKGPL